MATIATTLSEADRLVMEIADSVHIGTPLHREISVAIMDAEDADICSDVFLESSPTLDGLLWLWEIKHTRVF